MRLDLVQLNARTIFWQLSCSEARMRRTCKLDGWRNLGLLLALAAPLALMPGAPLLIPEPNLEIPGALGGSGTTDGTNLLVGLYSPGSNVISAQLLHLDGTMAAPRLQTVRTGTVPFVAFDGNNYFMVWIENPGASADLYGQLISRNGAAVGSPFLISSNLNTMRLTSFTANSGSYLAAWICQSNTSSAVVVQLFSTSGTALGPAFAINSPAANASQIALTSDETRHFAVWVESVQSTNAWSVRGRFITSDGELSDAADLNAVPISFPTEVAVARGRTEFLAVWTRALGPLVHHFDCCPGCPYIFVTNDWKMLFGRTVDVGGAPKGAEIEFTKALGDRWLPRVGSDGTNFLVTWADSRLVPERCGSYDQKFFAQQVSAEGELVNPEFQIAGILPFAPSVLPLTPSLLFARDQFRYIFDVPSSSKTIISLFRAEAPFSFRLDNLTAGNGYFDLDLIGPSKWYSIYVSTNFATWKIAGTDQCPPCTAAVPGRVRVDDPYSGQQGPRFFRGIYGRSDCISNLMIIDHVKAVWALEHDKVNADLPVDTDLFGSAGYLPAKPKCPHGGIYTLNEIDTKTSCTRATIGHSY